MNNSLIKKKQKSLQKQIELLKLRLSYEKKIKELKKHLNSVKAKYLVKSKSISGKKASKKVISNVKPAKLLTKKNAAIGVAGLAALPLLYRLYTAYNKQNGGTPTSSPTGSPTGSPTDVQMESIN
jgi:hypothetical protein